MPRRALADPTPTSVTIEVSKDEGGFIGWIAGAQPIRGAFVRKPEELPPMIAWMLGRMGYQGAVEVTWTGTDEAGSRAAKRLARTTSQDNETQP